MLDAALPFRTTDLHDLRQVPRNGSGAALVERVRSELPELAHSADVYCWIACEASSTRALTTFARKEIGIPKDRLHSMAYWRA